MPAPLTERTFFAFQSLLGIRSCSGSITFRWTCLQSAPQRSRRALFEAKACAERKLADGEMVWPSVSGELSCQVLEQDLKRSFEISI